MFHNPNIYNASTPLRHKKIKERKGWQALPPPFIPSPFHSLSPPSLSFLLSLLLSFSSSSILYSSLLFRRSRE
uniref:Uncharacterized protein n=1 Tax=Oryza brachyantha TaxID=4533 RepID=J3LU83_ORYBR